MVVLLFIDGLRASWMMSEQMVLWEHERSADETTPDLSPLQSWKKQGELVIGYDPNSCCYPAKLFPYVFLCCVFRGLSFALIVSMLRYWSFLLYLVLILGIISLGHYFNPKDHNFVIRGVKSVLSIGDIFCYLLIHPILLNLLLQLMTGTTSSMKASSRSTGQLATA